MPTIMTPRKLMVIRHAEKPDDTADIRGVDDRGHFDSRGLSVRGWQRAGALVRFFAPRDGHFSDTRIETPQAIFAASSRGHSARSLLTVQALAGTLGLPLHDDFDDVPQLLAAASAIAETVLISWRHDSIAQIGRGLLGERVSVPEWDEHRFDLVWVFARAGAGWTFEQVPQLLLPGDSGQLIA